MLFFDIFHLDSLGLFVPLHRKECLLWKKKWLTGWRLCLPKSKKVVSSKWLAEQLGKDRGTVSKWVTNTMQPDARNLLRIAEALNIDAGRLLNQKHLKNEWNKQIKSSEVSKMQFKERLLDSYDIGCELVAFSTMHVVEHWSLVWRTKPAVSILCHIWKYRKPRTHLATSHQRMLFLPSLLM